MDTPVKESVAMGMDELIAEQTNRRNDWLINFNYFMSALLELVVEGKRGPQAVASLAEQLADARQEVIERRFPDAWQTDMEEFELTTESEGD
jgi:hypothetical protein